MAFSIAPSVEKLWNTELIGIPVGQIALFGAGMGISTAIVAGTRTVLKQPIISGVVIAVAAMKVPAIQRVLGPQLARVLAITGVAVALEEQFHYMTMIKLLTADLVEMVSEDKAKEIRGGKTKEEVEAEEAAWKTAKEATGLWGPAVSGPAFSGALGDGSLGRLGELRIERAPDLGSVPAGVGYSKVEQMLQRIRV